MFFGTTDKARDVPSDEVFELKRKIDKEKHEDQVLKKERKRKEALSEYIMDTTIDSKRYTDNRSFLKLQRSYKDRAVKKGIDFSLTTEEFWDLTQDTCFYCGDRPKQTSKTGESGWYGLFIYNGIDRLSSRGGYTIDNVVTCCGRCNRSKYTMSVDEFKHHVKKMAVHMRLL